jgi:hypothetical protein
MTRKIVTVLAGPLLLFTWSTNAQSPVPSAPGPGSSVRAQTPGTLNCARGSGNFCASLPTHDLCVSCSMNNGWPRTEANRWCGVTMPRCKR